ncbi:MAG: hypothetical protein LUC98_07545 [Lachnospiraceae bacterium]|nr:hypothetical protein [Lachnospiraceae bacterium]
MDENKKTVIQKEGKHELERLLHWISEHQEQWQYICDPEYFGLSVGKRRELIESLKAAGLYTAAYIAFWSAGARSQELEDAREQLVNEVIAELPADDVMDRMERILETYR